MAFEGLQTAVACILHVSTLLDARVGTVDGLGEAPIVPVIGLHADKLKILANAALAARGALMGPNMLRNLENVSICAAGARKTFVTIRRGKRTRFTGLTAWCTFARNAARCTLCAVAAMCGRTTCLAGVTRRLALLRLVLAGLTTTAVVALSHAEVACRTLALADS